MKNELRTLALFCCSVCLWYAGNAEAQSRLYPRLFDLQDVTLNDGVFKTAMELNDSTLLAYDVDRLLTPYMRQAGFTEWEKSHPNFSNWGSGNFRLDGHVGGHYLSALALAYAASHDEEVRAKMKERLDYMVDKMDECQRVFDQNTDGLYGYIGGLPDNGVWTGIYHGDLTAYNNNRGNVPLYTMHKIYAGLRDAWVYAGNDKAKACFLKLCDWGVNLISNIDDATLQSILDTEHGGINEMYADAYQMTGDERYLTAARRYCHQTMVDNMQTVNHSFLDNKHANTQVPKYIGFARLAQQDDKGSVASVSAYRKAAHNFWTDVVTSRTVALGGNSISEHFLPDSRCSEYITNPDGPESCNTNNMMKLTEDLFADDQDARYADFYEQAMLNHILSTQNPHTGGYVYFTSLRPQHYRMYSQVNQGMWCCVGTGMENHSKYGEFIYAHSLANDTLYVNLFVASTLKNDRFALTQSTGFPYEQKTTLNIGQNGSYVISLRRPSWCKEGYKVFVNGEEQQTSAEAGSYVCLSRSWKAGDKIEVEMPMKLELVECPNYPSYVAFRYGPVLLGAVTGTENLVGQFAGEGRMDHAPSQGAQLSLTSAPMLIGERSSVLDSVYMVDQEKLHFKIRKGLYSSERFADLVLQPFFTVHEARYMMYWNQLTQQEWDAVKDDVLAEEQAAQRLSERTLDFVATGEQQSDAGHVLQGDFEKGSYSGEFYVDALSGKWFSYQLATQGVSDRVSLMCRYHSADYGRIYTLSVNGKVLKEIKLEKKDETGFYNVEYFVPSDYLLTEEGEVADSVTVKFEATGSTPTPGIYYLRLLKEYQTPKPYEFVCNHWVSGDQARVDKVEYDQEANTIKVYGKQGENNIALQFSKLYNDSTYFTSDQKYFVIKGTNLKTGSGLSYLWWFDGANHGTQVAPEYTCQNDRQETFVIWDLTTTGLTDYMIEDSIVFSNNGKDINTVFGLTSSAEDGTAVISDISFYSAAELLEAYPELSETLKFNVFDENKSVFQPNSLFRNVLMIKELTAGQWNALCVPFNMTRQEVDDYFSEVKKFVGLEPVLNGILKLYFEDAQTIEQGKPYLVKPVSDCHYMELTSKRVTAGGPLPDAVTISNIKVQGTYALVDIDPYTCIFENAGFEKSNTENVKGLSVYLQLPEDEFSKLNEVMMVFDEMPDALAEIEKEADEDAIVYTVDGKGLGKKKAVFEHLPQGLYIVNGKKLVCP